MARTFKFVAALGLAMALAACGGSPRPSTPAAPATTPSPMYAEPSLTPSPTPSVPSLYELGMSVAISAAGTKVTAYAYKQPVATSAPKPQQSGYVWGAAEVKVCVAEEASLAPDPWKLLFADGSTAEASSTGYQQFPLPTYDYRDDIKPGHCQRGWITYPVPKDYRPAVIEYSLSDGTQVIWLIDTP